MNAGLNCIEADRMHFHFQGDEHESEQSAFYCGKCCSFHPAEHFTMLDPTRGHTPEGHAASLCLSRFALGKMQKHGTSCVRPGTGHIIPIEGAGNLGNGVSGQDGGNRE